MPMTVWGPPPRWGSMATTRPRQTRAILLDEEGMAVVCIRASVRCPMPGCYGRLDLHGPLARYHDDGTLYYETPLPARCSACYTSFEVSRHGIRPNGATAHVKWTDIRDRELLRP